MKVLLSMAVISAAVFAIGGPAMAQEDGFVYEVTVKGMT